jgi:hypothetical protein
MRAEAGGEAAGVPGPEARRPGSSCRRPSTRRSAPLPRHSAWNARGWKLSTSCVAASRVGQQKVPRRGEAMGRARRHRSSLPGPRRPAPGHVLGGLRGVASRALGLPSTPCLQKRRQARWGRRALRKWHEASRG